VSGEDSRFLQSSFNAQPTLEKTGVEPIRAPAADPLSHMVRHGSPEKAVAQFVAEYALPLDTLIRKVGHAIHPFQLGCTFMNSYQVIEGHKRLNEAFATCMREGRADVSIHPLALFVLGGAVDEEITRVFLKDLHYNMDGTIVMQGFYDRAYRLGRPGFLENKQAVAALIKQHDREGGLFSWPRSPAAKFLTMLRSVRAAMAVLAASPILVDTGLYKDVLRPRTYSDTQAEIGNFLANQPNHQARVKTLTGEYVVKTLPPPQVLSEDKVNERIGEIKGRMRREGYTKSAQEVEEEIRKRHEFLRGRVNDAPPPSYSDSRRRWRRKPPDAQT
jgi:hypothetical protein